MDVTKLTGRTPKNTGRTSARTSARARRMLAAVALAGAGVGGALAEAPAVSAAPDVGAAVEGLRGDGCTGVPDSGPSFNFYEACEGHDSCYEHKPYGADGEGRKRCDDEFYDAMVRWCEANHGPWTIGRGACKVVAGTYWSGVRDLGWMYW